LREVMSSLLNTLRRWQAMVRRLMNSRAPLSAFERPSRASRAIWITWAVNCSRVSSGAADALAGGNQLTLGARGERLGAHAREPLKRGAQLVAGVEATPLAPQPLAIEQVGPRELHAHAGAPQPLDRVLGASGRARSTPDYRLPASLVVSSN
jgi:hypothetical protein